MSENQGQQSCLHKYVHLRTIKKREGGGYSDKYTLVDYYFCEHCLEEKEKKKEEYSRDTPLWYY